MGSPFISRATTVATMILLASATPRAALSQAVLRGVLYDDATGTPVRGTVMLVDPSSDAAVVHTTTDSVGQFSLETAGGVYQIAAVRPGYTSVLSAPIRFLTGERLTVRVPIAVNGDPQHQIGVIEHVRPDQKAVQTADALQRNSAAAGFESRRSSGIGLQFDRAALEKSNRTTVGEFLQSVPGFTVRDPNSTASMRLSRNAGPMGGTSRALATANCHIGWFLDGHRIDLAGGRMDPLTDGLGSMSLDGVTALEAFRGVSELPAEFSAPDLRCGAVAIWSKRGP
jgi:hypothetical protein